MMAGIGVVVPVIEHIPDFGETAGVPVVTVAVAIEKIIERRRDAPYHPVSLCQAIVRQLTLDEVISPTGKFEVTLPRGRKRKEESPALNPCDDLTAVS